MSLKGLIALVIGLLLLSLTAVSIFLYFLLTHPELFAPPSPVQNNEAITVLLNSTILDKRIVRSTIYGMVGSPPHPVAIPVTNYILDLQNGDNRAVSYKAWNLAQKNDVLIVWVSKNDWLHEYEYTSILRNGEEIFRE